MGVLEQDDSGLGLFAAVILMLRTCTVTAWRFLHRLAAPASRLDQLRLNSSVRLCFAASVLDENRSPTSPFPPWHRGPSRDRMSRHEELLLPCIWQRRDSNDETQRGE